MTFCVDLFTELPSYKEFLEVFDWCVTLRGVLENNSFEKRDCSENDGSSEHKQSLRVVP